ncbi:hypothetical protein [Yersinia alsatica]|nr:hypothetical protein [Yersinia alsatica]
MTEMLKPLPGAASRGKVILANRKTQHKSGKKIERRSGNTGLTVGIFS